MASLQSDNQRKQHISETQEFSQADVQHINMERQKLVRQISGMETEVKDVDQSVWTEEMEYGKFQEKVVENFSENQWTIRKKCNKYFQKRPSLYLPKTLAL